METFIVIPSKNIHKIESNKPYFNSIKSLSYTEKSIEITKYEGEIYRYPTTEFSTRTYSFSTPSTANSDSNYDISISNRKSNTIIIPKKQPTHSNPKIITSILGRTAELTAKVTVRQGLVKATNSGNSISIDWSQASPYSTESEIIGLGNGFGISKTISGSFFNQSNSSDKLAYSINIRILNETIIIDYSLNGVSGSHTNIISGLSPFSLLSNENDNLFDFDLSYFSNQVIRATINVPQPYYGSVDWNGQTDVWYFEVAVNIQDDLFIVNAKYDEYSIKNTKRTITSDSGDIHIDIEDNELIQYVNDVNPFNNYANLVNSSINGIETAVVECAINDYYDIDGNKVISKDGSLDKMCFGLYDIVIPFIVDGKTDIPLSTIETDAKTFIVLGMQYTFKGTTRQKLYLQEWGNATLPSAME